MSFLSPRRSRHASRGRKLKRRLRGESLESRRLLAADLDLETFRHNDFDPEDVNGDGQVSAVDALSIINAMNGAEGDVQMFTDVNNDGRRSASDALRVINRMARRGLRPNRVDPPNVVPPLPPETDPNATDEVRSIDGTGNNVDDPELGSTDEALLRIAEADYADGISEPSGEDRPSAREISNALSDSGGEETLSERDLSAFLFVWGQFIDHDIDLTHTQDGDDAESFDIEVPAGDPLFDPFNTGEATIPFTRSEFDTETGTSLDDPREQINSITAFIDGSQVYGSDQETAESLRSFIDGKLLISDDGLLPTDDEGNVLAGDVRAAENLSLTSMHALFVREHNRLATEIAAENPEFSDEDIYQEARANVIAEIQAITFNEFLPALLGEDAISEYTGYDSTVDPSIASEFSTAGFRFGHSAVNDEIGYFWNNGTDAQDAVSLTDAFFNPSSLEETGIDQILKYNASALSQEIDIEVVEDLRSFLFGPPGAGGLDLAALNIQRGRDHGLADYNSTREAYGLDPVNSFAEITDDATVQQELETLYGDVNNIDLWVGVLAEDHVTGASVGELATAIISDQFERLRDGDRFWYENVFRGRDLREIENTSLADVIERNTDVEGLQDNVFVFSAEASGRVVTSATHEQTELAQTGDQGRVDRRGRDRQRSGGRDQNQDPGQTGVAGVTVELLDADGIVVDTTETDASGNYRFDSFARTGEYQIQIADNENLEVISAQALDVLISSGDVDVNRLRFDVIV